MNKQIPVTLLILVLNCNLLVAQSYFQQALDKGIEVYNEGEKYETALRWFIAAQNAPDASKEQKTLATKWVDKTITTINNLRQAAEDSAKVAQEQREIAQSERDKLAKELEISQLLALSRSYLDTDPTLALRIIYDAYGRAPQNPNVCKTLHDALKKKHYKITLNNHFDDVTSTAFSPNGKMIVTGCRDGGIRLWDVDGKLLKIIPSEYIVYAVTFSPDGNKILSGGSEGIAVLWNLDGQVLQEFENHDDYIFSVCFSPKGDSILTGSFDNTAKLWDLNGNLLCNYYLDSQVQTAYFSPQGDKILTTTYTDSTAILWSVEGDTLQTFYGHEKAINTAIFSPQGDKILTGSQDNTAKLWDLNGNLLQTFYGHKDWVDNVDFSPEGKKVLTGSGDNTVKLWDLEGNLLQSFEGHQDDITSIEYASTGDKILTGSNDNTAKIWDLESTFSLNTQEYGERVHSVYFSIHNNTVLIGDDDGVVSQWDLEGDLLSSFKAHKMAVLTSSFLSNENIIMTQNYERETKLWNQDGDSLFSIMNNSHETILCTSKNGNQVLRIRDEIHLELLNLKDNMIKELDWQFGSISNAEFFHSGNKILIINTIGEIRAYEIDSNDWFSFEDIIDTELIIQISPNEKNIFISETFNPIIKLWNSDGSLFNSFQAGREYITGAAFSFNDKYIITGNDNGKVRIWDLQGNNLQTFTYPSEKQVCAIHWTEKGIITNLWIDDFQVLEPFFDYIPKRVYKFSDAELFLAGVPNISAENLKNSTTEYWDCMKLGEYFSKKMKSSIEKTDKILNYEKAIFFYEKAIEVTDNSINKKIAENILKDINLNTSF